MTRTTLALLPWLVALVLPVPASASPLHLPPERLAGRCVTIGTAGPLFLKATRLGGFFLLHRTDGTDLGREWHVTRAGRGRYLLRPTRGGDALGGAPQAVRTARGCRRFPEAGLNVRGHPFAGARADGAVVGLADAHMHVTAEDRAGGRVVSGRTFDPAGIAEALGRDADVHGPDGALDITGNLLRDGVPIGTHETAGWPSFSGWPTHDTNTHQQVYWRWLQRAWMGGLRLLVAQVVEDEPLCRIEPLRAHSCDETETIELEVRRLHALQDYVDAQAGGRGRGFLRLVTTPRQARRVITGGRLAVLIGVESSNPFGCSIVVGLPQCDRGDVDRGIKRLRAIGVRTIFPAHWVDNALAGAALEGGAKGLFIAAMQVEQTGSPFVTGACPQPGQGEGGQCNVRGLTALGEYAVRRLMDAHMVIEMDHLAEAARERVLRIAEDRHYPLVSSHTGTGGAWTAGELRRLYALGGLATATLDGGPDLVAKIARLRGQTAGNVALATDTGGFATLPGPAPDAGRDPLRYPFRAPVAGVTLDRQRTGTRTFDLNADGVAHYGLIPDLLADAERRPGGRTALRALLRSAEAYLRMWARTGE